MKIVKIFFAVFIALSSNIVAYSQSPLEYKCLSTNLKITIDGDITDQEWSAASWTSYFVDIQGDKMPEPSLKTRIKLLYDREYLYIAAELEEPYITANRTLRDDTLYFDNDFEVFIDTDADSRNYLEFEINAFGTEWDLLMPKPYSEGGRNDNSFDFKKLQTAIKIYGTLNDSTDIDQKWTLELAFPIDEILSVSDKEEHYKSGTLQPWMINFSRVEWLDKDAPRKFGYEENWVWSPIGEINMHIPSRWGKIIFIPQDKNL